MVKELLRYCNFLYSIIFGVLWIRDVGRLVVFIVSLSSVSNSMSYEQLGRRYGRRYLHKYSILIKVLITVFLYKGRR